eukprot:TRINITY_DN873_c0_g1_i23.p1 TRINITY_DN873_c0_g1~~TRINITY_DN873_c0_g1_i23.p1  ORF type:complete len:277 (+),score=55.98 TRINITY_DN873_c0_g1_i23:1322-2152(+)
MSDRVLFRKVGRLAYITLNYPSKLNAIGMDTPYLLKKFVKQANNDDDVHVIVLTGNGSSFCSGYDLSMASTPRPTAGSQSMPWDPTIDFKWMYELTECYMSIWKSMKPVICGIQGYAIGGGSDIALCCDIILMEEDAKIGYPPVKVWGCPTTAFWTYRVGLTWAKRILLTGDLVDASTAERINLVTKCVKKGMLKDEVDALATKMARIPQNQLAIQKMVVNEVYNQMGLGTTQRLATLMDGITRHTPEGVAFQERMVEVGVRNAVRERDAEPKGKL